MTLINAKLFKSGTGTPLTGYIKVTSNTQFYATDKTYVVSPVTVPLVAGEATFDLSPSDISNVAYSFEVFESPTSPGGLDTLLYKFEAVVPFSATTINFNTLAPQLGIRYDLRDSSLLTLARYLVNADPFINFLGSKLWANRGNYSATTTYRRGDVVLFNGSSYQYVSDRQLSGVPVTNTTSWQLLVTGLNVTGATVPVGTMLFYATGATLPPGFLRCDGRLVLRSAYPALFQVIGTIYGAGNGTTTFNIPDSPINGAGSYIVYAG